MFRVKNRAPGDYHPKEQILGLELNGIHKAYPFSELKKQERPSFADQLGDSKVVIHWNVEARSAHVTDGDGKLLVSTTGYWFAWYAFFPETLVYKHSTT